MKEGETNITKRINLTTSASAMARNRKEKDIKIKLKQPCRSAPDPSHETLLDLAEKRGLLRTQNEPRDGLGEDGEPLVGRLGESILWSISLTMLHFTLDVLVANQYAVEIKWPAIITRAGTAFPGMFVPFPKISTEYILIVGGFVVILLLFYSFHPHPEPSIILPTLPPRIQPLLHQIFFFIASITAGCYLIHISNTYGYYAVMKQSPPVGCLWIWSVIELNLGWAAGSLLCCVAFLKIGGYAFM